MDGMSSRAQPPQPGAKAEEDTSTILKALKAAQDTSEALFGEVGRVGIVESFFFSGSL
jgi:hypothetical protein